MRAILSMSGMSRHPSSKRFIFLLEMNPEFAVDVLMRFVEHTPAEKKGDPLKGEMLEAYWDGE